MTTEWEDDEYESQSDQLRLEALARPCPRCANGRPGHYCAGNGMHMERVYFESDIMLHWPRAGRLAEIGNQQ